MSLFAGKKPEAILIQPPLVQLNSPYPAPYYLKSFLTQHGFKVCVRDHSIGLFERIFCRTGLEKIFAAVGGSAVQKKVGRENFYIKETLYNIECFISEQNLWINSIDRLVDFLRGRDDEWGHFLALSNGCLPSGPRHDAFAEKQGGAILPDHAKLLATKLLSDLADFINVALDPGFNLIRYSPHGAESSAGYQNFDAVEKSLSGFIMEEFYRPMLFEEWENLKPELPFVLGITIPFPGCLAGALVCAASAKNYFCSNVFCITSWVCCL